MPAPLRSAQLTRTWPGSAVSGRRSAAGEGQPGRVAVYVGARTEVDGVPPVYLALEEFAGLTDGVYVG